jgi:subtilisin-like proprotein convertase family protein
MAAARGARTVAAMITKILCLLATMAATTAFAAASASADSGVYSNDTAIEIPDSGDASVYPSTIDVGGLNGKVRDVSVTLRDFSHSGPDDVDILLVSPDGDAMTLMSDACGASFEHYTFTFTRYANDFMHAGPAILCDEFLYKPTEYYTGTDAWPGAPPGFHPADFDELAGGNPNGTWKLYVVDDTPGNDGEIHLGWTLGIDTVIPDTTVPASPTGQADHYPETQTVSGLTGVVSDVNVTIPGVYHKRPEDLQLILVGPGGQAVKLMGNACPEAAANVDWAWDDEATDPMPTTGPCPSYTYKPTEFDPYTPPPAPAPERPYGSYLSTFDYTEPNGDWKLYAYDDQPGDKDGFFAYPFKLDITTRPKAKVGFTEGEVRVAEGQSRQLTLSRTSGGQGLGAGSVKVTSTPRTATSGSDYTPVSTTVDFAPTEATKTISVEALADALHEDAETFDVTIGPGSGDAEPGTPTTATVTIDDATPADPPTGTTDGTGTTGGAASTDGGGTAGSDSGGDRDAPAIGGLRVTRKGIAYTLSEPASVALKVKHGRRARTLRRAGRAGRNKVALRLRPGTYRVAVAATDAAGNRATSKRRLRVKR